MIKDRPTLEHPRTPAATPAGCISTVAAVDLPACRFGIGGDAAAVEAGAVAVCGDPLLAATAAPTERSLAISAEGGAMDAGFGGRVGDRDVGRSGALVFLLSGPLLSPRPSSATSIVHLSVWVRMPSW